MATVGASQFAMRIQRLGVIVALSLLRAEVFIGVQSRGVPLVAAERKNSNGLVIKKWEEQLNTPTASSITINACEIAKMAWKAGISSTKETNLLVMPSSLRT